MWWIWMCLYLVGCTNDTAVGNMIKRCYKKTILYSSACSDKNTKFYYYYNFSRIFSETKTRFLEHQCSMSLRFSWLLCLSLFHPSLYLLNSFCACFLPVPLITILYFFVDYLNVCDDISVKQLRYIDHLHAYNRQLNMVRIWCKKPPRCLLNKLNSITNK